MTVRNYVSKNRGFSAAERRFLNETGATGPKFKKVASLGAAANFLGYGVGTAFLYFDRKDQYGKGGALLMGIGEVAAGEMLYAAGAAAAGMLGGLALAAAPYLAYEALDYGNQKYKTRQQAEFGKQSIDSYGTKSAMRMQSISNLSKAGNTRNFYRNEAIHLHR